ncbi:hypothetical protein [Rhodococcus sp. ACT016]
MTILRARQCSPRAGRVAALLPAPALPIVTSTPKDSLGTTPQRELVL